jgi:hypothetical protein
MGAYEKRAKIARAFVRDWTHPYSTIPMAADTTSQLRVHDAHYSTKDPDGMYDSPHKVCCKSIMQCQIFSDIFYSIEISYHSEHM